MNKRELKYYKELGNWDFSNIKYKVENLSNCNFLKK